MTNAIHMFYVECQLMQNVRSWSMPWAGGEKQAGLGESGCDGIGENNITLILVLSSL